MSQTSVSVDEFRTNLSELIGRVMYGNDKVVIKKYNRGAAVLLGLEEYERLIDPTKRLSQTRWEDKFRTIDRIRESMPNIDPEVIEKKVRLAVATVRLREKHKR